MVDLDRYDLLLCKGDRAVERHRVALGQGGVGKTKEGDRKTPVGTYRLGKPRGSKQFGTFIHIGYPTRAQRAKGYTGSAIGIHGPARGFGWAGPLNTLFDLTLGCVMVESDEVIQSIARWVERERVRKVHLEQDLP